MIDRVSEALNPLYNKIGQLVRTSPISYVDETSYLAKDISGTVAFIKRPMSPEMCIISFCGGDTTIRKKINLVGSKFNKLIRFILLRKPRALKDFLLKMVNS